MSEPSEIRPKCSPSVTTSLQGPFNWVIMKCIVHTQLKCCILCIAELTVNENFTIKYVDFWNITTLVTFEETLYLLWVKCALCLCWRFWIIFQLIVCILVGTLNSIACQQLDKFEHDYPIITKPTEEVFEFIFWCVMSFLLIVNHVESEIGILAAHHRVIG